MRKGIRFNAPCGVAVFALLIGACAQQPTKPEPAPTSTATTTSKPSTPSPTPESKPKPKPKSTAPTSAPTQSKPETKETPPTSTDGLEASQVGYYIDTLQGRLRQSADPNIVVTRPDNHIVLDISKRIHFGSDATPLAQADCDVIAPIAKALVEYRMTRVVADVHATTSESAKARTAALTKCLVDNGVAARRVVTRESTKSAADLLIIEPIVRAP